MSDLPPPPAPKPAKMPPMSEADKQKFGMSSAPGPSSMPAAGPMMSSPMMASPMMSSPMMSSPMMGSPMMGGSTSVGMGPNLVFNFGQQPGMCMVAPVACCDGGKEEEKPPAAPQYVQGNPTWYRPRMPVKKGQKMKDSPCTIM
ncbi:hypothetical protein BDF21DRAFT_431307 [Thamnidium elegans]|uniref:Uncharacterized protein n=1 Tax=Thamnidium elegans TaxID=101142 RepID=A0A8H7VYG4_9FUNG|nr:hypothetical protein INT48_005444 [Thamnidium elegans]KAI8054907.1 hypothetical protein BDF21DRAFT_431307 [Thamnidium elegans]